MTQNTYESFFSALSGSCRLAIVQSLKDNGTQNVSAIASSTQTEQSLVSRNLQKLQSCQFVSVDVRGKHRYYSLNEETVVPLLEMIDRHVNKFCKSHCNTSDASSRSSNSCPAGSST